MKKALLNFVFVFLVIGANGQVVKKNLSPWPVIEKQMRPWTRWWWMGSAVDQENLGKALTVYAKAGMGGVEITPIYGVKGFESKYIDFLSPQWMTMLNFTVKKAAALGMGVDMNTGTGWPFGGPQITPEFAASKMIIQQYQVKKGNSLTEAIRIKDPKQQKIGAILQSVTAYSKNGHAISFLDKAGENVNKTDRAANKVSENINKADKTANKADKITDKAANEANKNVNKADKTANKTDTNGETLNLLDKVDENGMLNWTATSADYEVFALFSGKTLQQVKRAAPAGAGYTLDHLDQPAVNAYLNRFDKAFSGKTPGVRAFFNDSYEVYGANWTPSFFKEFKQLKGYDLSQYVNILNGSDSTSATAGRVKSDYRETMAKLLLDNFTKNWTNWAHRYKSITKNQSHGSPGNLLDLYAIVDIPETEIFGSSYFPIPGLRRDPADVRNVDPDPIMSKFASSAAHTTGKTLVSSETFTWLTEHFKTSFSQAKPEAEQLFLSGINHIFYHGTTYTPADIPFPGWLFYASTNMVPANSLWPQLQGMNTYFSRCQSMLQAGKSDNELLIYWPVYDQWAKEKGLEMPMKVHDVDVWLHPTEFYKQSLKLQKNGYSFDFASEKMLAAAKVVKGKVLTNVLANPYQTVIIPACKLMPLQTLKDIVALAHAGATVIFQKLPEDVPGLSNLENNRLLFMQELAKLDLKKEASGIQSAQTGAGQVLVAEDLPKALAFKNIHGEQLIKSGLQFIRRKLSSGTNYFLVNHTAKTIDQWIPINQIYSNPALSNYTAANPTDVNVSLANPEAAEIMILDPQSGDYGLAQKQFKNGQILVKVYLEPGETLFLQTGNYNKQKAAHKNWVYLSNPGKPFALNQSWKLHFTAGGPVLPADRNLATLVSWTDLGDPEAVSFSGTGEYTTSFILPNKIHKEYILDLGQVDETAHVWINGKDAGYIWSIPFKKRIGQYLLSGKNTIKIEVANLMANRIRDMDQKGISWRNYQEINFVNIDYKPFDASGWKPMPSGLLGPVVVTGYN